MSTQTAGSLTWALSNKQQQKQRLDRKKEVPLLASPFLGAFALFTEERKHLSFMMTPGRESSEANMASLSLLVGCSEVHREASFRLHVRSLEVMISVVLRQKESQQCEGLWALAHHLLSLLLQLPWATLLGHSHSFSAGWNGHHQKSLAFMYISCG